MKENPPWLFGLLAPAVILAFFLFFTWKSIFLYFDADDMYNLYMAWSKPLGQILTSNLFFWNGAFRPMGAVFYRTIFAAAGFDPLPFHVALLTLGVVNLALCFWLTHLISASQRVAALAALIFAFQSRMMEVWFRTAVIYDVLCFTFLYVGLCVYIKSRRDGRVPGVWRIAAILVCFILALDAKEMAICLPVLMAAWELLFQRTRPARIKLLIGALVIMAVAYTFGKLHGPDSMTANPDYRLEFSFSRFAQTWDVYLGYLFIRDHDLKTWASMTIIGGLLAGALISRSRILLFAWVVIFFGMLPVLFAPPRGGFVMLVSWPGWVLYGATVLVAFEDVFARPAPQYRTALACLIFMLVAWRFGKWNLHDQRADPRHWLYDGPTMVHAMADQMLALHPVLPEHARMLFLNDPFGTDENTPIFVIRLLYEGPGLHIDRSKLMPHQPPNPDDYQYVFTYESGRYRELK